MIKFSLNKRSFIDSFLQPITKVSERGTVNLTSDTAETIVCNSNTTIILHCKTDLKCDIDHSTKLNIGNVAKLQKAIECIPCDDPEFQLNKNHIRYISPELRFSYHLVEDKVIPAPTINIDKLNDIKIDTSFIVSKDTLANILRISSFTHDSDKIYFYTRDDKVYCELNDRTRPNLDNVDMLLSSEYAGDAIKKDIPLRIDWLRDFSTLKFDNVSVRYGSANNIVIFYIKTEDTVLKYIVSGLVK